MKVIAYPVIDKPGSINELIFVDGLRSSVSQGINGRFGLAGKVRHHLDPQQLDGVQDPLGVKS